MEGDRHYEELRNEIRSKEEDLQKIRNKLRKIQLKIPTLNENIQREQDRIEYKKSEYAQRLRVLESIRDEHERQPKQPQLGEVIKKENKDKLKREVLENILAVIDRPIISKDTSEFFYVDPSMLDDPKTQAKIHTVRVYFVTESSDKRMLQECVCFKINSLSQFGDLRNWITALWKDRSSESFKLYDAQLDTVDEDDSTRLEQFCISKIKFPEFWSIQENSAGRRFREEKEKEVKYRADDTRKVVDADKAYKENLDKIFENYLGLQYYLPPITESQQTIDNNRLENKNTSVVTIFFLLLLLIFSIAILIEQRHIKTEFWVQEGIRQYLSLSDNEGTTFDEIKTTEEYYHFITDVVAVAFFGTANESLTSSVEFVGPIRFRQVRTKTKDCPGKDNLNLEGLSCYEPDYNGSTRITEDRICKESNPNDCITYQTADQLDSDVTIRGAFGKYEPGGYVIDITPEQYNDDKDGFIAYFDDYKDQWFHPSVRAYFITSNIYSANYDLWVYVRILVEVSTNGLAYPSDMKIVAFQPNIVSRNGAIFGVSIARLIFTGYFVVLYVLILKETDKDGKRNWKYMFEFLGIMDLLMIASSITAFVLSNLLILNEEEIFTKNEYYEFWPTVRIYSYLHMFNSITLMTVLLRIVLFLSLHEKIFVLIKTIETAGKNMVAYIIILVTFLSGYAMIAQSIWGTYNYMYRNFTYAFFSLLLLTIGHGDFNEIFEADITWSVIFFLIYFFSVVYFLLAAFMGIYMDAYKAVMLIRGYQEKEAMTFEEFKKWIIPKKVRDWKSKWDQKKRRDALEKEQMAFN